MDTTWRSRLRYLSVLLVAAAVSGLTPLVNATSAGSDPILEIVLSVASDGTQAFDFDPLDDGAGAHTPGADLDEANNVVRLYDSVLYRVDWSVNEGPATNVVATLTAPTGTQWSNDPAAHPPAGCSAASSLSTDLKLLTCVAAPDAPEGSNGAFRPRLVISPIPGEAALYDNQLVTMTTIVGSDQTPAQVSNAVTTTVSSTPTVNWVKGEPEVLDVANGGTAGRLYIFPLTLQRQGHPLGKGIEQLDDSVPLDLVDHAFDIAPNAVLAPAGLMGARAQCAGYDGSGRFVTSPGLVVGCTDVSGSYPMTDISVSGHDSTAEPAVYADGSGSQGFDVFTIQVGYWAPLSELDAKADAATAPDGDGSGTDFVVTAISNDTTPVVRPATAQTAAVTSPIEFTRRSGSFEVEYNEDDNTVWSGHSVGGASSGAGGSGGFLFAHSARFWAENAYTVNDPESDDQEFALMAEPIDNSHKGAAGYVGGDGTVVRGQEFNVNLVVETTSNYQYDLRRPVHGCLALENEHVNFIDMVDLRIRDGEGTTVTEPPTDGQTAHVRVVAGLGLPQVVNGDPLNDLSGVGVFHYEVLDTPYTLQVARSAADVDTTYAFNDVTCNNDDADAAGWVDASGDLSVFANGDGTYSYDRVRIILDEVSWNRAIPHRHFDFGTTVSVLMRVKAKEDLATNPDGSRIRVHSSRSWGEWDFAGGQNAPTASLDCWDLSAYNDSQLPVTTTGWCNQDYTLSSEDSGPYIIDPETYSATRAQSDYGQSHDIATITVAEPYVEMRHVDGPDASTDNGQIESYELTPRVVGGPTEALAQLILVDESPDELTFVSATPAPDSFDIYGNPQWEFGTQVGGWVGPTVTVNYRTTGAVANETLINVASFGGVFAADTSVMAGPNIDFAEVSVVEAADKSLLIKAVDALAGPCFQHPVISPRPIDWASGCSLIDADANMSFDLQFKNDGNTLLEDYRIVDVFPYQLDGTEPASATGVTGDGRSPESSFDGTLSLVSAVDPAGGATVLYSADVPATISRDAAASETANTWCDAPAGGTAVFGAGSCPTSAAQVTAIYADYGTLLPGESGNMNLVLDAEGTECDNVWTNNFGARSSSTPLPIRSNDVSIMVNCNNRIGNLIWVDLDRDGLAEPNEPPIEGMSVELHRETGTTSGLDATDTLIATTTTDQVGNYWFAGLDEAATYYVAIPTQPTSTWTVFGDPVDHNLLTPSLGASSGPADGADNTDDGHAHASFVVASGPTTLSDGGEPTGETDANTGEDAESYVESKTDAGFADAYSNLTVDVAFTVKHRIGNLVFADGIAGQPGHNNGIADPGESPIVNLDVELHRDSNANNALDAGDALVATTTTNGNGNYWFDDVTSGTYFVAVPDAQDGDEQVGLDAVDILMYRSSQGAADADAATDDTDDGDPQPGYLAVTTPFVVGTKAPPTNEAGDFSNPTAHAAENTANASHTGLYPDSISDLSVDLGFVRTLTAGGTLWQDTNNNGIIDAGEPTHPGARVEIYAVTDSGGGLRLSDRLAVTTTGSDGSYEFTYMTPGDYVIVIPAAEFHTGSLVGMTSSIGNGINAPDPDDDVDSDDNGYMAASGSLSTAAFTLGFQTEPDANTNHTFDLGLYQAPPLALGNRVWRDVDGDGRQDSDEPGIANVVLELIDVNTGLVEATTRSNQSGYYEFTNLDPGVYSTQIPASNFATGGALANYQTVSPDSAPDPEVDLSDTDDQGMIDDQSAIVSLPVILTNTTEPIGERPTPANGVADNDANFTIDFGFVTTQATQLAFTGSSLIRTLTIGSLLLALGAVTVVTTGRRRKASA